MKPHKWAKEIKAWADGAEIEMYKGLNDDIWDDAPNPNWNNSSLKYRIKLPTKCITKDCLNHVNEGEFVGELCAPCWDYIANGKGVHSQAYRNAQPKEPQYLYVYFTGLAEVSLSTLDNLTQYELLGKIKLEVDDE